MQQPRLDPQRQPGELRQENPSLAHPPQTGEIVDVVCPDLDGLQVGEADEGTQELSQVSNPAVACHLNHEPPASNLQIRMCESVNLLLQRKLMEEKLYRTLQSR